MKSLEIISSLPQWAKASPSAILDSPAFMMPCRIGDETSELRHAQVEPAESESLALSVEFGGEPHELLIARSPRFPELDKIWDSRSELPEPILVALVEKECGPLFQMLENAVRKQMRLNGCLEVSKFGSLEKDQPSNPPTLQPSSFLALQTSTDPAIVFSLTRSRTVVSVLGTLRNLDLSHESIRSQTLPAECEYAAFAAAEADLATLAPGDAVLVQEVGTVPPKLVVDGRFVVDTNGVTPVEKDALVHVRAAEGRAVSLGEAFDAVENPLALPSAEQGAQLKLVKDGRVVAFGRLDKLADQLAFIVEAV